MSERRLLRLAHTLWNMRPAQMAGKLGEAIGRRARPVRLAGPAPGLRLGSPATPYLPSPAHTATDGVRRFRLLNRELDFAGAINWDTTEAGRLWAFHLHQFDWARDPSLAPELKSRVLEDWVMRHRAGVGWHPAPISLRTYAWLKLLTTPGALPDAPAARTLLLGSLADQLATLEAHPERALLGNHYLCNLLALVLAGVALEGSRADDWLGQQKRLCQQLEEQVGPDGAHYERSPMYHSLILENVLDLVNVARQAPGRLTPLTHALLAEKAARMLGALAVWTHPDDEIALFGDSAFGIAQRPAALRAYAAALGIEARGPSTPGVLDAIGFVRLSDGPFTLIASAAPPMPSYQPGHAHCDALSFELSVGNRRVVTDTGVTEYTPGPLRDLSRTTRSHATVEINGREQAELWAAHRIGARPDAGLIQVEELRQAEAVCSGWATPEVLHRRRFHVNAGQVEIHDSFDRAAPRATLRLPLAPGCEPRLEGCAARIQLGDETLGVTLPSAARWRVEQAPYFPEFGRQEKRAMLVGEATALEEARWSITLE